MKKVLLHIFIAFFLLSSFSHTALANDPNKLLLAVYQFPSKLDGKIIAYYLYGHKDQEARIPNEQNIDGFRYKNIAVKNNLPAIKPKEIKDLVDLAMKEHGYHYVVTFIEIFEENVR